MQARGTRATQVAPVAVTPAIGLSSRSALGQGWPEVVDPDPLLTLNLSMAPADWDTIRFDTTNTIEVHADSWADGEEANKLDVAVRRKSCSALPNEPDPLKIRSELNINECIGRPG